MTTQEFKGAVLNFIDSEADSLKSLVEGAKSSGEDEYIRQYKARYNMLVDMRVRIANDDDIKQFVSLNGFPEATEKMYFIIPQSKFIPVE